MDRFDVSVLIPTHNRRERVQVAIASVLAQTYPPLEVIVVDDASTDGTDGAALERLDPRVRYIRHETNKGGAVARNTALKAAKGDWVAFLDSDDLWLPTKLERQVAVARALPRPRQAVISCNARIDDGVGGDRLYNRRPPAPGEGMDAYFLIEDCSFQTSTLLLDAELARSVGFDERLPRHQDWDFLLRLFAAGAEPVYVDEPLTIYLDIEDQTRITRRTRSVQPSLSWFEYAEAFISPAAMQSYYARHLFGRHLLQSPGGAMRTAAWLSARPGGASRAAFAATLAGRLPGLVAKLARRAGGGR